MVDALKKKQTITSPVLRLGTFRLVFSGSFFPHSWNGQWNNRPLGPSKWTALWKHSSVKWSEQPTKIPLIEICTVWEYEHYPFFHCGSARKALTKRNTSSVVGFIFVALYNTSDSLLNCCSNENFKAVQKTVGRKSSLDDIYFPATSNLMKVLGLRWASNVTSAYLQTSFRNKGQ